MQRETRTDRFTALEDRFAGYEIYDPTGSKIGKVDDLFVDEGDQPEYIGVKMGLLGTRSTLIPWELVEVREDEGRIIAALDKDRVKDGPAFDDDREITPEFENDVYSYYGLQQSGSTEDRGSYADYTSGTTGESSGPGMTMGDTETGQFREHAANDEGVHQSHGDDLADEEYTRAMAMTWPTRTSSGCRGPKKSSPPVPVSARLANSRSESVCARTASR